MKVFEKPRQVICSTEGAEERKAIAKTAVKAEFFSKIATGTFGVIALTALSYCQSHPKLGKTVVILSALGATLGYDVSMITKNVNELATLSTAKRAQMYVTMTSQTLVDAVFKNSWIVGPLIKSAAVVQLEKERN